VITPGQHIGGYRIERMLGRGGMAVVYEAVQLSLERRVALKVLAPHLSEVNGFRNRFRREALLQASFSHDNVVPVHDFGDVDGQLYLVMSLVPGDTLKDRVDRGPLSPGLTITLLEQVADALDSAHSQGLVHRDVKPQNILLRGEAHAYLGDFGLSRLAADTRFTRRGQFVGTVDYVAPEQIQGITPTAAADVYSLTAVLFECLCGVVPFLRPNDVAVLYAHTQEPPPRAGDILVGLPRAIDDGISKGMAKEPQARYPSATALIDAARVALAGVSERDATPTQTPTVTTQRDAITRTTSPRGTRGGRDQSGEQPAGD